MYYSIGGVLEKFQLHAKLSVINQALCLPATDGGIWKV